MDYWFSAGDVLPVEVSKRWQERFGKSIYQGYGATETCGGVSMCPVGVENPPRSVGRILSSKEVRIVDPATQETVTVGEAGKSKVGKLLRREIRSEEKRKAEA